MLWQQCMTTLCLQGYFSCSQHTSRHVCSGSGRITAQATFSCLLCTQPSGTWPCKASTMTSTRTFMRTMASCRCTPTPRRWVNAVAAAAASVLLLGGLPAPLSVVTGVGLLQSGCSCCCCATPPSIHRGNRLTCSAIAAAATAAVAVRPTHRAVVQGAAGHFRLCHVLRPR